MYTFQAILCFIVCVNTDFSGHSVLALSNPHPHEDTEWHTDPEVDSLSPEMLQELLWFFRREDPSTWNYCILGLSLAVLLIGVVLLGLNIRGNRKRKVMLLQQERHETSQPDETEKKQAFIPLKEDINSDPFTEDSFLKPQNMGEVQIQWKDGNVTTLFPATPEEDV